MTDVQPWPLIAYSVPVGGTSVAIVRGQVISGLITNPLSKEDQGLTVAENLYIDFVGPAGLVENETTVCLFPGQSIVIAEDFHGTIWANAVTNGHKFSGITWRPPSNYIPQDQAAPPGIIPFPPSTYTTLLETIPSYLYEQYTDDDDLQAFVAAYNILAQQYVDWFVKINLPIYTDLQEPLLDWVAAGLYGISRPVIPYGQNKNEGPLNTWVINTMPFNTLKTIYPTSYYLTTDDIFKRIITWHFFKGDGDVFNIRWLKRRITRFLEGEDGKSGPDGVLGPAVTSEVSITFGAPYQVNVSFGWMKREIIGGAIFNGFAFNTKYLNELNLGPLESSPSTSPMAPIFKAAAEAGLLELPFQFKFNVTIVSEA